MVSLSRVTNNSSTSLRVWNAIATHRHSNYRRAPGGITALQSNVKTITELTQPQYDNHNHQRRYQSTVTPPPTIPYVTGPTTHFGYRSVPLEEKQERVKRVFQNVAENYDLMNDLMSAGIHRHWKDEFCRMTRLEAIAAALRRRDNSSSSPASPQFSVLDVAGGTGDVAFRLLRAAQCPSRAKSSGADIISVTVCDINPSMLAVGERRARAEYGDGIIDRSQSLSFREGNAEQLPFEEGSFDLYSIAFGLRNVTDVDAALRDAMRVLKPGGRFMCLEFSKVEDSEMLRQVYDWYSFNVIPTLGKVVADDEESYQYLVESIRQFSGKEELKARISGAGFEGAGYTTMSLGIVAVHEGWKPL